MKLDRGPSLRANLIRGMIVQLKDRVKTFEKIQSMEPEAKETAIDYWYPKSERLLSSLSLAIASEISSNPALENKFLHVQKSDGYEKYVSSPALTGWLTQWLLRSPSPKHINMAVGFLNYLNESSPTLSFNLNHPNFSLKSSSQAEPRTLECGARKLATLCRPVLRHKLER